ncbi:CRISPR-associated helicase Cas3' [Roseibium sp. CAU 1637]|uniref:CRISPR-associated helicase Cas3 n=1 Tax=Roseibium limicola TaxID=2816037 RepID=A0A939ERB9_9HYPH|nr:CRISPR-associated helicase Cas3' [Roseibium limicola]MBO0346682.1 CRISPR-associated helicase Cas3' [Roseibium limicola]
MFYAHSGRCEDLKSWQPLVDHLRATADLAASFGRPLGIDRLAFLAGLYHDLGKYSERFQQRLAGKDIHVDHSTAGAVEMMTRGAQTSPVERLMLELVAYCIAGHHAGLPDRKNETGAGLDRRLELDLPALDAAWKAELGELSPVDAVSLVPDVLKTFCREDADFSLSVLARMIFSCLVDADFQETEAFYDQLEGRSRDRAWPALTDCLPRFVTRFETYMAEKAGAGGDLNQLRGNILRHVRLKAKEAPGLFTLTVPTGGGKTLASLGFALDHARSHDRRRIIYAIPFTSIIDQTAAIFRKVLGDEYVLEHHSAIDEEKWQKGRKEHRQQADKLKMAMEDWAAPVVVTTNVQFFESLFAARTSRARKLHNIAGSIIILDEAQTVPRPLLKPAIRMLDELARAYGCSIVLCTATQPALGKDRLDGGLPLEGRELAPDPQGLATKLRRATICMIGDMSNADLTDALAAQTQALIVVNSRKHALELFQEAANADLEGLVHLTTRQCAAHRREILENVRTRLAEGKPCRVIATSLIEAGVDVDFPKVWRAEAGLDQIIQAAGRCNREGRNAPEDSIVTVFSAPDYPPPREIKSLMGDMDRMRKAHGHDLQSLAAIEAYFGEVYWRLGDNGLDAKQILGDFTHSSRGTDYAFRTVAEKFRMIESGMVPVILPWDDKAREAIRQLAVEGISSGKLARTLQTYVVQVPPKARALLLENGKAEFIAPKLRGDQFCVLTDEELYREDVGLMWEDAEYLSAEQLMI